MHAQVNAKIGGINMYCPTLSDTKTQAQENRRPAGLLTVPTLILGGDVSHGGHGSRQPSVCALVGNINRHVSLLSASLSISRKYQGLMSSIVMKVIDAI